MRIISIDVGMKNLAYCILNIPVEATAATASATAALSAHPAKSSTSSFSQESLDELMKNITIERWDVIDLRFEPTAIIPAPAAKLLCNNDSKQAKYMYIPSSDKTKSLDTPKLYCLKCSEKSKYKIPSREIMPIKRNLALLQKKKMDELIDIYNTVVVPASSATSAALATDDNNKKIRKADKIKEIEMVLSRDYLEPIDDYKYAAATAATAATTAASANSDGDDEPSTQNIVLGTKKTKVNYTYAHDLDMITYGRNLMKHMDAILYPAAAASAPSSPASALSSPPLVDMMIIENQISTIATRMKTLQGMITQYFIMKNVPQIEFISASCKLKLFTDSMLDVSKYVDATTYGDRKKAGITICRALGEMTLPPPASTNYATWMPMFEKHKKKDDLADCFLQCLWRVHLLMGV
jgi:hypothetical protein